ncbi:hypothetical protein Tco_0738122 [Tanacetum coccineum]
MIILILCLNIPPISFYETSSSSPPALPIRKRYRGTSKLVEDTEDENSDSGTERESLEGEGHALEDEGPGSEDEGPGTYEEEEEATLEGQQQLVPLVDITTDEPLGLGYRALRRHKLALREGLVPSTFEVGQISRSLEREQERAMVTFSAIWRLLLALEAWAGQTDAREQLRGMIYMIFRARTMI